MDRRANLKISSVQDQPHSNSPDFISDNQQQVQGVSSFSACFASQRLAKFELLMQCEVAQSHVGCRSELACPLVKLCALGSRLCLQTARADCYSRKMAALW